MTKTTNYHRKFKPNERPYGSYDTMFVFTGDRKDKNISKLCSDDVSCPKETDAYIFQRHILRNELSDLEAVKDIYESRRLAIAWFLQKLHDEKFGDNPEHCECVVPNLNSEATACSLGLEIIDPLETSAASLQQLCASGATGAVLDQAVQENIELLKQLGKCDFDIELRCKDNVRCKYENKYDKKYEDATQKFIIRAYARPYDDGYHLHMGHGKDACKCSTEQADVREGGYRLHKISNKNSKCECELSWAFGDYYVGINCPFPLIIHFESKCPEISTFFKGFKEPNDPCLCPDREIVLNCSKNQINICGPVSKKAFTYNICFTNSCDELQNGLATGFEVVSADDCFVRKHIRNVLTFPCGIFKKPINPDICQFCVNLEPFCKSKNSYGEGLALISLDKRNCKLQWNIMYKNLSSEATSILIKGPIRTPNDVIIDVGEFSCGVDNPVTGCVDLGLLAEANEYDLDQLICDLIDGKWFIMVKTDCFLNGEIRGAIIKTEQKNDKCNKCPKPCTDKETDDKCPDKEDYEKNCNQECNKSKYI